MTVPLVLMPGVKLILIRMIRRLMYPGLTGGNLARDLTSRGMEGFWSYGLVSHVFGVEGFV